MSLKDFTTIDFPLFSATKDEKGNWICKAKDIEVKKKNGVLKAQYKDLPRVKAIYEIESNLKNQFKKTLVFSTKQINDKLIEFTNANSKTST